jgi:hypothetical protein
MYSQLTVAADAVKGRDDDFNDWYSWVHIRDVLRLSPVTIAAQRFRRADRQLTPGGSKRYPQAYFALYETTDPVRCTYDHRFGNTPEMPISTSISLDNLCEGYFDLVVARTNVPGERPKADLVVERIELGAGTADPVTMYANTRLPHVMTFPGVVHGTTARKCAHQMIDTMELPGIIAIYWTTDLAATLSGWTPCEKEAGASLKTDDVSVDCFIPLIDRLTAIQVREPDPKSKATAKQKRDALGTDTIDAPPPGFEVDYG